MPSISNLIAARVPGDRESLDALAVVLVARLEDTPEVVGDPVEWVDAVDTRGAGLPGTWQEVRAARDHGDLSSAEYDHLAAAVEALTREDTE